MTGKEIAENCAKHELCENCELMMKDTKPCADVIRDMNNGVPATIFEILEKEYSGGGEE